MDDSDSDTQSPSGEDQIGARSSCRSSTSPRLQDQADNMAPVPRRSGTPTKREADFSNVLSMNERHDLVELVDRIISRMKMQMEDAFASSGTETSALAARSAQWNQLPGHLNEVNRNAAGVAGQVNRPPSKTHAASNQKENVRLSTPSPPGSSVGRKYKAAMAGLDSPPATDRTAETRHPELKKECGLSFAKWLASLRRRVGDIELGKKPLGPLATRGHHAAHSSVGNANNRMRAKTSRLTLESDERLTSFYPPTETPLSSLSSERRALLLHAMLLLVLSLEHYNAWSRLFLVHLTSSLRLPLRVLAEDEVKVAKGLARFATNVSADEVALKRAEDSKGFKKWKSAGSAGAGDTLPLPLVVAGVGTALGGLSVGNVAAAGLLGTVADNTLLVGSLLGVYGTRATGKTMEQYVKDMQDYAFRPLRVSALGCSTDDQVEIGRIDAEDRRLRMVIGISGWLHKAEDVTSPWQIFGDKTEAYALRYEFDTLAKVGSALGTVVRSVSWARSKMEFAASAEQRSSSAFSFLFDCRWPTSLLKISKALDNPWCIGMVRSDKAGSILADFLLNRVQGDRAVTLIGYGLGARVIYSCLMTLGERRAFGYVENAVLIGCPAPSNSDTWCTLRGMVAGRLINVYSTKDYLLGFLYRTCSFTFGVAGLQKVEHVRGVENVDVSERVSNHLRYRYLVGSILALIGWDDMDKKVVQQQEDMLQLIEARSREHEKKQETTERVGALKDAHDASEQQISQQSVIQTRMRKKTRGRKK